MMRFLFTGNQKLLNSIASKAITKCFKKCLRCKSTKVDCKDISFIDEGDGTMTVHVSMDVRMNKEELMNLIDRKLGESE